jgi:hypothetical protein
MSVSTSLLFNRLLFCSCNLVLLKYVCIIFFSSNLVRRWLQLHANHTELFAFTVDHGFRSASDSEALSVKDQLVKKLRIKHEILKCHFNMAIPRNRMQVEGRKERYKL